MIQLHIDTSNSRKTIVRLFIDKKVTTVKREASTWSSQILLLAVEAIIKQHKLKISQLQKISVNCGPGSYTGLRVGIAVANTLSYLLEIPVNNYRQMVLPIYE